MDKINVLIVVGSMNRGGAETMLMNLIRKADLRKIRFNFLYCTDKQKCDYDEELRQLGINIYRILPPSKVSLKKHINDLKQVFISTGPYDAIHINTLLHAGIVSSVAKKCNIKNIIVHSHSTKDSKKSSLKRYIYESISKYLIKKNATGMISCGYAAGVYLFGKKSAKKNRIVYLNNGIDLDLYSNVNDEDKERYRKQFSICKNQIVIGNVGRLVDIKNQEYVVEVCKKLKDKKIDFKAFIIGEGPNREKLEKLISKEGLNKEVVLLGLREDIAYMMNMFDIFLLPSLFEGFPLVLVEAQASGLLCLVSENVSKEVNLDNDNLKFLSIDQKSIEDWTQEIKKFSLEKGNNKNEMLRNLSKYGFNAADNLKKLEKIYRGEYENI